MAGENKLYIRIPGTLVEVSKELYSEYFAIERRLQTLEEKDERHGLASLDDLQTGEFTAEEVIIDRNAKALEDCVITKIMADKVKRCVERLSKAEQDIVYTIYYDGLSEREAAKKMGIPYMTLHDRKMKILNKLKKLMEK